MLNRLVNRIDPLRGIVVLSCLLILFNLIACSADDLDGKKEGKGGQGFVSLNLKADTAYVVTKASSGPENADDYKIRIYNGEEEVTSFRFGDSPEQLPLEAGDYVAKASWGTLLPAAFDSLYVEGVTNFSVKEGEVTSVKLECRPANAKVTVDYADDLKKAYSDYSVSMSTSHTGNAPLVYVKDEARAGYFQVDTEGERLNLKMMLSASGKDYIFTNAVSLMPRDLVRLHFKLGGSNNGGNTPDTPDTPDTPNTPDTPDTPDVPAAPDPTLTVNVAGLLFEAGANLTQSVTVTSNSTWTIVNSADWLTVEKQTGKAVFTAKENTTEEVRKATVTLVATNGNKSLSANIEVFQQAKAIENNTPDLAVDIVDLVVSSDAFRQMIAVRSTKDWSYTTDAEDWLKVSRTEATEDTQATLTLSADANTTNVSRKATVILTAGDEEGKKSTVTIQVEQKAKEDDPYIHLDFSNLKLPYTGVSGQAYKVETNQKDWSVSSSADWLKVEKGEGQMLLTLDPNEKNEVRSAELILTASQGVRNMAVKITVTQEAKPLDVPPLKVVITINRELTEKPIEYVIENKYSTDKMFDLSFSTKTGIFQEMKTGMAPENFYLNILGQNGAKIQKCEWAAVSGFSEETIDLVQTKRIDTQKFEGLIWDDDLEGKSLATIYLENFVKKLSVGYHEYKITVTGVEENGVSYSSATQLKIQITE